MAMRQQEAPTRPLGRDDIDWDALVRLHGPRLQRRVAQRVADPEVVDDVVQETFVQAYRRWSTYEQTRPLWPWLVAIAVNLGWRVSKAGRLAEAESDDVLVEAPLLDYIGAAGSDDHVANLDRRAAIRVALDGMTMRHRRALLRWELERRSAVELAASEGMTPQQLRATVVRARRNLRERYLAAAGEGPFAGVALGLGALVARWRDRLARIASSGGWAEAAGAFAAAPVVAMAGMAMITLAPAPTVDRPNVQPAEQPVAFVHDAVSGAATAPDGAVSSAPTVGVVGAPAQSAPPPAAAPTLAAGPAAAGVDMTPDSHRTDLALDGPNGGTESHEQNRINCEYNVVTTAVCQVSEAAPVE
jgi:RNA polymerase sigma-70 factor (ECF subfamily)